MSLFRYLFELQVNGNSVGDDDDFNVEDDNKPDATTEDTADTQGDDPADAAQNDADATADQQQDDNAEDNAPTAQNDNDPDTGDDQEDNFTLDDSSDAMDNTEADTTDNTTANDDQQQGDQDTAPATDGNDDAGGDEASPEDDGADDNFTMDGGEGDQQEGEDGGDAQADDGGGGDDANNSAPANGDAAPKDPTDAIDDEDDKAAEEAIYDTLTDDQKRVRTVQLKLDFKDLYDTMTTTIEGINGIPKNSDNLETIKRLISLITKARNILVDYIENNFDTNPYIENYTIYMKYLAVFRTASKVIDELNADNKK